MEIHVITIFPELFEGFLNTGMIRIAREKNLVQIHVHNLRDYAHDKHRKIDDEPYGGGPGMVIKPEPVFRAVEDIAPEVVDTNHPSTTTELILLSPQGQRWDQSTAQSEINTQKWVLLCGRYEGFDERIRMGLPVREISIGDYVLTGGEVPAMVLMDSVIRLIPGVLGDRKSLEWESFSQDQLDFPQYTRPAEFQDMAVPPVLLNGNHKKIEEWRREQARIRTSERRNDLQIKHKSEDNT